MQLKGNRIHLKVITEAGFGPGLHADSLPQPQIMGLFKDRK